MSPFRMSDHGPAQLELIRRYARTLRELHADAVHAKGPRIGAREHRAAAAKGSEPLIDAARALPDQRRPPAPA